MENFKKSLQSFFETTDTRIKLQKFYLFLTIFGFILACVVNLFDSGLGRIVLIASVCSAVIFIINAIIWTICSALISNYLPVKSSHKTKK